MKASKMMVRPLYKMFFADIPEVGALMDVEQMIKDGLAFDFNQVPERMIEQSWVPSYCKASHSI
jgi:hypothetical protein